MLWALLVSALLAVAAEPRAGPAGRQGAWGSRLRLQTTLHVGCLPARACLPPRRHRRRWFRPLPHHSRAATDYPAGTTDDSSSVGVVPAASVLSVAAICLAGIAAVAFLLFDKWRRAAAAQQRRDQLRQEPGAASQPLPAKRSPEAKPRTLQEPSFACSPVVQVAARATSLQPPSSAPKTVNLQVSRSMPAAVSPFAAAAVAQRAQAPSAPSLAAVHTQQTQPSQPLNAPAALPVQQEQHSPFAAAAAQPPQPKQLSPFASATAVLSETPSDASTAAQQLASSGSTASELARRASPPHLSAILDGLPIFAGPPGVSSPAQSVAAGLSVPQQQPSPLGQRSRSPGGGRHPPARTLSPDRISLQQLRSEILGDDQFSCSEPQLESLLSTGLPAAGAAAHQAAAPGGSATEGAQQPAGGSPSAAQQQAPSGGQDGDWEIAPNGGEVTAVGVGS